MSMDTSNSILMALLYGLTGDKSGKTIRYAIEPSENNTWEAHYALAVSQGFAGSRHCDTRITFEGPVPVRVEWCHRDGKRKLVTTWNPKKKRVETRL